MPGYIQINAKNNYEQESSLYCKQITRRHSFTGSSTGMSIKMNPSPGHLAKVVALHGVPQLCRHLCPPWSRRMLFKNMSFLDGLYEEIWSF